MGRLDLAKLRVERHPVQAIGGYGVVIIGTIEKIVEFRSQDQVEPLAKGKIFLDCGVEVHIQLAELWNL